MEISAEQVKKLREKTGVGLMDCKEALRSANGDMEKAVDYLRERGLAKLAKRTGRATTEGSISAYIHTGGKIGAMAEVNCESDFVAKTGEFQTFVKDVVMQIAASSPLYVRREEVPPEVLEREKTIYRNQARESGKPEKILDKIAEGKLEKFYQEVCLMEQPFIKNADITIKELLEQVVTKLGENIVIRRFARFQLGETVEG